MQGRIHSLESFGTVDGPGVRYVVFVQGCPMRCAYCHNPDTWEMNAGTLMEPEEILENYERNKPFYNGGGITVTGGEPLMQIDFLLELFTLAHARGIHTCLDTSGIAYRKDGNPEWLAKLDRLCEVTDLVMLDIKHIDPEKHKELVRQQILSAGSKTSRRLTSSPITPWARKNTTSSAWSTASTASPRWTRAGFPN